MSVQSAEYGPTIDGEVDPSHGVFRTFHMCNPIDRFPILDSDVDLNNGQISSNAVKKISPSQFGQMVTKNMHTFMQPDFNPEQALRYVKEFVRKGEGQSSTKSMGQKVDAATSEFYTYWEDEWVPFESTTQSPARAPTAPSGPAPSQGVHTTTRVAQPPRDIQLAYEMADLECTLALKSTDASAEKFGGTQTRGLH